MLNSHRPYTISTWNGCVRREEKEIKLLFQVVGKKDAVVAVRSTIVAGT